MNRQRALPTWAKPSLRMSEFAPIAINSRKIAIISLSLAQPSERWKRFVPFRWTAGSKDSSTAALDNQPLHSDCIRGGLNDVIALARQAPDQSLLLIPGKECTFVDDQTRSQRCL